ncbi:MAG TPA: DNA-binding protein [Clostridiales bacterium]|nr:DNA-binding protein [Clostridiales bacterium]
MNKENNIMSVNKESDIIKYDIDNIKNLIYTIRGKQVMLDHDVAMLYHYETKKINQTVKRNIQRFPEKFCFQLNEEELENLRSQIVTSSLEKENYGGRRYLPYVFTEQGIAMLSGLLRNEIAIQVSINIMDAFVEMRKFLVTNGQVFERLSNVECKLLNQDRKLSNHEKNFEKIFDELQKDKKEEFNQKIFFDGQIYDSYRLIIDIIKTAKNKILIIDNYIDDSILKMLSKKNKDAEVIILTSQNSNISKLDINKFNKQYPTLKVSTTRKFHDRFIAIDNKDLYHIGASLKDLGKKCFAISKMNDIEYIKRLEEFIS